LLVNIYNQPATSDAANGWAIDKLQNIVLLQDTQILILGNFNLHHPWCDPNQIDVPDKRAKDTAEWLRNESYTLLTTAGEPTQRGIAGQQDSTINLAFTNPRLELTGIVSSCAIMEDLATGSDHIVISIQIEFRREEIREEKNRHFNLKKADWGKFRQVLEEEVGDNKILGHLLKNNCMTQEQLDKAATKLSTILQKAAENSTK
jgi:hypothetical protein